MFLCFRKVVTGYLAALLLLTSQVTAAKDKFTVLFNLGDTALSAKSKAYLDSLIYLEKLRPGVKLSVVGYADYLGDSDRNMVLSEKRAENVKAYLLSMGFNARDIEAVQWKGELAAADTSDNKTGIPGDRKVDIMTRQPAPVKKTPVIADPSKLKLNDLIRLNILFKESTHQYLPTSIPIMEALYKLMNENPTLRISIEGHICCGSEPNDEGYNMDTKKISLSTDRAKAVYDYLVKKGIPANRMSYKGMKFTHPIFPEEKTQEERDMNKRVEIRIVGK